MRPRGEVVPLHRGVDRDADATRVTGFDLLPQEVALETRMATLRMDGGVVVDPPVVASREARHGVDMAARERVCERVRIERRPHPGDVLAGVEVHVDLAEAQSVLHHGVLSRLSGSVAVHTRPSPGTGASWRTSPSAQSASGTSAARRARRA